MPIPTLTPEYVRETWGKYNDFVFRFLYTVDEVDYNYDAINSPDGWDKQNIKIVRSNINNGLVRSFAESLEFAGVDAQWLLDFVNNYRYNVQLVLDIYQLNNSTLVYELYYHGFVDLTKFGYKDYKYKIDVTDNQVQALIDNNGDNEYSLTPVEYTPYLVDFEYSGVEMFEIGTFEFDTNGIEVLPTPSASPPNECFINLGASSHINLDTKQSEFYLPSPEVIEYVGNQTLATSPWFKVPTNGTVRAIIKARFTIVADAFGGLPPIYWELRLNKGSVDTDTNQQTLGGADIVFDSNNKSYLDINVDTTFNVNAGEEWFLMLRIIRDDSVIAPLCDPFHVYNSNLENRKLTINFRETYVPKQIKGIPFSALLSLSSLKSTNGIARIVNNSSIDFTRIFFFNGNMIRNLLNYNLNVKLKDLINFVLKKYGLGYEMNGNNITFDNITDFFDNTSVGYEFSNVSNFEIIGYTDRLYSTIKAGDKVFDSEYLSGKYSVHEETIFKTPVDAVSNELDLMCEVSTNPFEIEDMFRKAVDTETLTDYEGDYQLVAIIGNLKSDNLWQIDRAFVEENSMPSDYFYIDTIYNLQYSPIRIIERNLMPIHQTLLNNCDKIKAQKRTKYEGFYCAFLGENVKHEFQDFTIYPRCATTTEPYLTDNNNKIEPQLYSCTISTETIDMATLNTNAKKLVKITHDGNEYFGFINEFGLNPLTNEPNTLQIIKAYIA